MTVKAKVRLEGDKATAAARQVTRAGNKLLRREREETSTEPVLDTSAEADPT